MKLAVTYLKYCTTGVIGRRSVNHGTRRCDCRSFMGANV